MSKRCGVDTTAAPSRERLSAGSAAGASPQTPLDVLAIVVTYNSDDVVGDLLKSLPAALDGCTWKLVVADNDSRDTTVDTVRAMMPDAHVVEMGRNAGYAAGINAALAVGPHAHSVLILNPDSRLAPASVPTMLATLSKPGVGIVIPRLLNSQRALVLTLRREPTVRRALGDTILTARRAGRFAMWSERVTDPECYARETTGDWAAGTVMLISRDCLDACDRWDESFFLYSEETEFCLRARDNGFKVMLAPDAEAVHLGGESRISPNLWALLVVNRVRLYRRRHTAASTAVFWLVAVVREASRQFLGRQSSRQAVGALLSPRRARQVALDAAGQMPNRQRRRALTEAADAASVDKYSGITIDSDTPS